MATTNVYFSCDVEADGPVPGPYSMSSFGLAVAGIFDGAAFTAADPTVATYYAELKPISEAYDPEAAAVSGLDRDRLVREGLDPGEAMTGCAEWVRETAGDGYPVFAAFPLSFDWMWMYWYFVRFADGGSPFGHSRCLDMKTMYAVKARAPVSAASKARIPKFLRSGRKHTHHALDDAIEQADLLANLFAWPGR